LGGIYVPAKTPVAKHVPLRTCIGCGTERAKRDMWRIVHTPEGKVCLDGVKGKMNGRGAYVCPQVSCLESLLKKKALNRAFKSPVEATDLETLKTEFVTRLTQLTATLSS
jgi:uncharacterized protein